MGKNGNPPPELKQTKDKNTTIQQYQDIVDRAHKEIIGVRTVYIWLGAILGIIISVGTFFTYRSASEFRRETREDLKSFSQDIKEFKQEIRELKREVEERVDKELRKEDIQKIIKDKVSARVDEVAEEIIKEQIIEKVTPQIETANSKLFEIDNKLKEAEEIRKNLEEKSKFLITVIGAQNDDREKFERLIDWSKDKSFLFSELASLTAIRIRASYGGIVTPGYLNVSWKGGIEPDKLSFDVLRNEYNKIPPQYHTSLLKYIWERKDISKKQKMQFLADVLASDKSLTSTHYAGKFFAKEASLKWNPFVIPPLLEWWEQNKDKIEE